MLGTSFTIQANEDNQYLEKLLGYYKRITDDVKNIDTDNVLSEYPRPLLKRDSYINLNGIWQYAFTSVNKKPNKFDGDILVPFSPEAPLSGVNRQLKPNEYL